MNSNGCAERTAAADKAFLKSKKQNLPETCGQAADFIAQARMALNDESMGPDQALAHLDEAIACLMTVPLAGRPAEAIAAKGPGIVTPFRRAMQG